jgi:hypothetical protein
MQGVVFVVQINVHQDIRAREKWGIVAVSAEGIQRDAGWATSHGTGNNNPGKSLIYSSSRGAKRRGDPEIPTWYA